jgi:serine/threonine protein kinase
MVAIISDIQTLRSHIELLSKETKATINGKEITGAAFELYLATLAQELRRLSAIKISRVIPPSYTSSLTKKTVTASEEEKLTIALPKDDHSVFATKHARKDGLSLSEFILYDSAAAPLLDFWVEHGEKYPASGIARAVKKCFVRGSDVPKYALKVYREETSAEGKSGQMRIAMRNAYCNRLLGRTSYAFRRADKQYLISDWLKGDVLIGMKPETIKKIPMAERIKRTLTLLEEINLLHQHDIHNLDISPSNIMISDDGLHLFGFDSVMLNREKSPGGSLGIISSPPFLPLEAELTRQVEPVYFYQTLNKQSDIYAFILSISLLFPEVVTVTSHTESHTKGEKTVNVGRVHLAKGPAFAEHTAFGDFLLGSAPKHASIGLEAIYAQFATFLRPYDPDSAAVTSLATPTVFEKGPSAFLRIDASIVGYETRRQSVQATLLKKENDAASRIEWRLPWLLGISVTGIALLLGGGLAVRNREALRAGGELALRGTATTYRFFERGTRETVRIAREMARIERDFAGASLSL